MTQYLLAKSSVMKNGFLMVIEIRPQRVKDAKLFLEILFNPNFIFIPEKPKTIVEEKQFFHLNTEKRKSKSEFNFSIFFEDKLVGAMGVRIDSFRPYIGEIRFFIDEKYWNKGIASNLNTSTSGRKIINSTSLQRLLSAMGESPPQHL
jgi:RimJ/RimL family protein N-acetyltransferase